MPVFNNLPQIYDFKIGFKRQTFLDIIIERLFIGFCLYVFIGHPLVPVRVFLLPMDCTKYEKNEFLDFHDEFTNLPISSLNLLFRLFGFPVLHAFRLKIRILRLH